MNSDRVFNSADFMQPNTGEPIRSVVTQSTEAAVVAWTVAPGQRIAPHVHPTGQDTWTVLSGSGAYQVDREGRTRRIAAGDVVVARAGEVHGVFNDGNEPLLMIAVVSPAESGFEPL